MQLTNRVILIAIINYLGSKTASCRPEKFANVALILRFGVLSTTELNFRKRSLDQRDLKTTAPCVCVNK